MILIPEVAASALSRGQAINARQLEIHKDQVRLEFPRQPQPLVAIHRHRNFIPVVDEDIGEQ